MVRHALKQARLDAGVTQAALAERMGWPQSAISKVESGERGINVAEVIHWCRAVGMSGSEFFREVEERLGG